MIRYLDMFHEQLTTFFFYYCVHVVVVVVLSRGLIAITIIDLHKFAS